MEHTNWHAMDTDTVIRYLNADIGSGLSEEEALRRLTQYGPNQLSATEQETWLMVLLEQLKEPLSVVLSGAAVVTGILGEWIDFSVILFVVVLNAIIGTIQQVRAEKALSALKALTPPQATVVRAGSTNRVSAEKLVPGDMVVLQAGDRIPADLRIIKNFSLRIEEAALTGESVPVEKSTEPVSADAGLGDRINMAYAGTSVVYGRADCVTVATGMSTEVGRIAELLSSQETRRSPLQDELAKVGKALTIVVGVLISVFFAVGLLRGEGVVEMFLTAVGLAVAAIPEGLPTVVTVVLALGVQRMAHRNALIRKLPAVETLGSATFICSDKTGTLTQNKMKVTKTWVDGEDDLWLITAGFLCNDATAALLSNSSGTGGSTGGGNIADPTEIALTEIGIERGQGRNTLDTFPRVAEIPFDSQRKRMTTVHKVRDGHFISITKGAPDVIIDMCINQMKDGAAVPLSPEAKARLKDTVHNLSSEGLRVLCVATKESTEHPELKVVEEDLTYVGLLCMADPPRKEVFKAIETCKAAGITPVMITGDHVATARAIGKQIGMLKGDEVALEGSRLEVMSDNELVEVMARARVFARVAPEHKLRIVHALQTRGEVVAMTGDGVNDGPALRAADIGIAMGITGTDVAKEASAMTLADDNFATIIHAVEEGRTVYNNIQRTVHFLLSCNFGEITAVFGAILAGMHSPLTAVQILWVNLVTDSLPALGLGVEPPEIGVMSRPPRKRNEGILSAGKLRTTILQGLFVGLLTLSAYVVVMNMTDNLKSARTAAFATLGLIQFVQAYNLRAIDRSVFTVNPFSNPTLTKGVLISALLHLMALLVPALQTAFGTVPLGLSEWSVVIGCSLAIIPIAEVLKLIRRMRGLQL